MARTRVVTGVRKRSRKNSGCILNVELIKLADGLNMKHEREK